MHCGWRAAPTSVYATDLRSGRTTKLAQARWSAGVINWLDTNADTVSWVEFSRMPSDANNFTGDWRIRACDIRHCVPRVISENLGVPGPVPHALAGPNLVGWTIDEGGQGWYTTKVAELSTGTVRTLLPHSNLSLGAMDHSTLVFGGPFPITRHDDPNRPPPNTEIYTMPLGGGRLHQVGADHNSNFVEANDGYITWEEPQYGEGHQVWYAREDGHGGPHLLARAETGGQIPGDDFIAYINYRGLFVAAIPSGAKARVCASEQCGVYFSTEGDLIAFSTQQTGQDTATPIGPNVLRIYKVTVTR